MARKFSTREFIDHRSLGVFMEAAGDAVTVVSIHGTTSGTFVLFAWDDTDAMAAVTMPEGFTHQGAGRGFTIDAAIPDPQVESVDIKSLEVTAKRR